MNCDVCKENRIGKDIADMVGCAMCSKIVCKACYQKIPIDGKVMLICNKCVLESVNDEKPEEIRTTPIYDLADETIGPEEFVDTFRTAIESVEAAFDELTSGHDALDQIDMGKKFKEQYDKVETAMDELTAALEADPDYLSAEVAYDEELAAGHAKGLADETWEEDLDDLNDHIFRGDKHHV